METTKLIVEYLVAGALTVIAIVLMALSIFPNQTQALFDQLGQLSPTIANELVVSVTAGAFAYATGIISEYIGEQCFEWLVGRTKEKRITKFLKKNSEHLHHDPIFEQLLQAQVEKPEIDEIRELHGKMRFYVMHHSEQLYTEIALQVSRFRLIRVTFIIEVMIAIAIIGQISRSPADAMWWTAFILIVAIAITNFYAVRRRINRYCRAIERSYLTLLQGYNHSNSPNPEIKVEQEN